MKLKNNIDSCGSDTLSRDGERTRPPARTIKNTFNL